MPQVPLSAAEDPFYVGDGGACTVPLASVAASEKTFKYVSEHGITVPAIDPTQHGTLVKLLTSHGVDCAILRENFSAAVGAMAIAMLGELGERLCSRCA